MEKFRINNDLSIFWSITNKDGSPYSLSDKTVRLFVTHPRGRMDVTSDITVQDNVICWLFRGSRQRYLGTYKITIEIQASPADRTIRKDIPEAFELVSSTRYEQTEIGRPEIDESGELTLATSLDIFQIMPIIPQVGPNRNWWVDGVDTGKSSVGLTAYEFAKENGYEGTEEEYAAECLAVPVLNEESRTATAEASQATRQSIAQQESVNNYMNDVAEPTIARATKAASDAEQVAADIRSEADAALEGLDSAINSVNEAAETAKNAAAEATAAAEQAEKDVDAAIEAFGPAIANKADLDNGKIIPSQLPDYILGQVMYGGLIYDDHTINASSNFISKYGNQTYLSASDASKYSGVYFIASGSFTDRTIVGVPQVSTGDWIISTGASWKKVDNSDAVTSVAGLVGNVNASALAAVLADLKDANSLARKSEFKTINGQSLVGTGNIVIEGKNYDNELAEQSAKLTQLSEEIGISNLDVFNKYVGEIYAPNVSSSDVATLYIFRIAYFVSGAYYNFMSFRDSNGALLFDFQKSYSTQEEALAAWSGVHWHLGNAFLLKGNPTEPIDYNAVPITFTKDFVDSPVSIRLLLQDEDIKTNKAEIELIKKGDQVEETLFPSVNLFNGEYDEGFWLTSGLNPYSGYYVTKLIKIEGGKSYKYPSNSSSYGSNFPNYAVYDLSGNFVKVKRATTEGAFEILTEESDCFVSVNIGSSVKQREAFMFAEKSQYPETYQPYRKLLKGGLYVSQDAISSPLFGKILAVDGDSICAGAGYKGGYGKIIAERNGMTLENLGVGGGTIAAETYSKNGEARHWICRSVAMLREDADYILVEGGVNDPGNTVSMGSLTYGYNEELDDTTFYGAFESMLKTLITRFAGKKIGYIAVHKMTRQFSSIKKNGENNYYHAAKECCDKWGVPFLDLNDEVPAFGLFPNEGELAAVCNAYTAPSSSNPNVGDGWHPNEEGYKKYYCDKIEAFMLSL